jgi:26S proteasome regulatory subunit N8
MSAKATLPTKTILHPLVLLSAVDHYNRVAKDTNKRVCGVLLGQLNNGVANITSSFAIPFEEDVNNTLSWYLDHTYLENFIALHKKVTSERILGWYSSSPLINNNDLDVHEVFRRYCEEPIFICINVQDHTKLLIQKEEEQKNTNHYSAPAKAFCSVALSKDEIHAQSAAQRAALDKSAQSDGETTSNVTTNTPRRQFVHVPFEIGSDEAEEVGIEHVLRSIQQQHHMNPSSNTATLKDVLESKLTALHGFLQKMKNIVTYIDDVLMNKLPYNTAIINRIQDIISLIPVITNPQLTAALNSYTNDSMTVIYIAEIIKLITSLHDLIKNKQVMLAAEHDNAVKLALLESTKLNNNTKDGNKQDVNDEEFNMDSVARDRGDENKH